MGNKLQEKFMLLLYLHRKLHMRENMEFGPIGDTNRGQGRILALLKMRDGVSIKDLSYLLGVGTSTLSELLTKLEKNGYITREQSNDDKRIMIVKLTEKGRAKEQVDTSERTDLFSCLSDDEQKSLETILDKMISLLEEKLGYDSDDYMKEADSRIREIMKHFGGHGFRREHCFHGFHGDFSNIKNRKGTDF